LFAGSELAGQRAAVVMSLVQSAKLNGLSVGLPQRHAGAIAYAPQQPDRGAAFSPLAATQLTRSDWPSSRWRDRSLTMFKLTWFATSFNVNAEVNNGRGPVDYKVSKGKSNTALVEFKLASNSSLEKNLHNQVAIYEKVSNTKRSLKVILCFTEAEQDKVIRVLKALDQATNPDIVVIDASRYNKPSASKE